MKSVGYIKRYFYLFMICYIVVVFTKSIFFFYLLGSFSEISTSSGIAAIFWGYRFDFATVAIVAFLVSLFDFHKKTFQIVSGVLIGGLFLVQVSDIMYFYESTRHIGYEISDALVDGSSLMMTAVTQHGLLSLFGVLFFIGLFGIVFILVDRFGETEKLNRYYLPKKIFLLLITVFFVRGMFQSIPLNAWQANQIGDGKLATLALNGSYNIIYSLANKDRELKPLALPYLEKSKEIAILSTLYDSQYTPYTKRLEKPNIVLFFLESWSGVNMKSYGYDLSFESPTPFYDEIIQKSIRPKGMIAGGHRTTEGIFASLSGYQNPLGETVAKSQLQDFKYFSLINILVENGYSSSFFQGSFKETSGTGSFVQMLGFKESYGKRDVLKKVYEENTWGVHDPDLYNFVFEKLEGIGKPFVIGINGATTHDDKIPHGIEEIQFVADEKLNKQLNVLHFSDMALKEFVEKMEKNYPNTLFVFMADHCGGVKGSTFENYLIPFAFYHKDLKPQYYDFYISQRDFAPTILDAVFGNYKNYSNSFSGKSLLSDRNFFADYYHNGILGWIENNEAIELNIATNQIKCLDVSSFKDKEIVCSENLSSFKEKAVSFTNISQKLLFEGKTKEFEVYKKR